MRKRAKDYEEEQDAKAGEAAWRAKQDDMPPHKPPPIPGDTPEPLIQESNDPFPALRFQHNPCKASGGVVDLTRPLPWMPGEGTPRESSPTFKRAVTKERARRNALGQDKRSFKTTSTEEVRRQMRASTKLELQKMLGPIKEEMDDPMGVAAGAGVAEIRSMEDMWGGLRRQLGWPGAESPWRTRPSLADSQRTD